MANQQSSKQAGKPENTGKPNSRAVSISAILKETVNAVYAEIEFEGNKDYLWIPKSVIDINNNIKEDKIEFVISLVKETQKMEEFEVINETVKAIQVEFLDEVIWIPKAMFLGKKYYMSKNIIQFLLGKFTKIDGVIKETDKAVILYDKTVLPKKFIRKYNEVYYIATFRLEYFQNMRTK